MSWWFWQLLPLIWHLYIFSACQRSGVIVCHQHLFKTSFLSLSSWSGGTLCCCCYEKARDWAGQPQPSLPRRLPPNGVPSKRLLLSANPRLCDKYRDLNLCFLQSQSWERMALPNFRQTSSPGPMGGRKFLFYVSTKPRQVKHPLVNIFFWCQWCDAWIKYNGKIWEHQKWSYWHVQDDIQKAQQGWPQRRVQ